MRRIIAVLVATMMLCGSNVASQAMEKLPAGGEGGAGGGSPTTTAPGPTTTAPKGPTKTTTTKTVAQQCAIACHGSRGCGASQPAGDPTINALQQSAMGGSGTGLQPGACKVYQQCMQQCLNAHAH